MSANHFSKPRRRVPATLWLWLGASAPLLVGCPVDSRQLGGETSVGAADDAAIDDGSSGQGGDTNVFEQQGGSSTKSKGGTGGGAAKNTGGSAGRDENDGGKPSADAGGVAGSAGALAGTSGNGSGGLAGGAGMGGTSGGGGSLAGAGAGGLGGASSGAGGSGGIAGIGGIGGSTAIPCGLDVDQDGVDDCIETIARNSRFNSDVSSWQAEERVTTVWSTNDADAKSGSGAVSLTFSTPGTESMVSMAGVWQCVPEIALGFYTLAAKAFIPSGQAGGWASINVFMYSGTDCTGALVSGQSLKLEPTTNAWTTIAGDIHVPPSALSMAVRLVAVKPGSQTTFSVLFDNVLVRPE